MLYSFAFGRYIQVMTSTCSVLLDLDGTLIDSGPIIVASMFGNTTQAAESAIKAPDSTNDPTFLATRVPLARSVRARIDQPQYARGGETISRD